MARSSKDQDQGFYDIAIAGCGPTGATLAGLLGRCGLSVLVFDKAVEIYPQPRAVGFDHDAMRIFQRLGVTHALEAHVAPFNDGEYHGVDGQVIRRLKRMAPPYPQGWAPGYTCDQPGLEAVLREALARMPNVATQLGHELNGFTQTADAVHFTLRDAAGCESNHAAHYLVGCDGASSPVRRALGIGLENFDYDHAWVVVDVKVKPEHLAQLPLTNVQYCQPQRPSTFITCPGNHRRWEFMTLPGEDIAGEVPEDRLWALLSRWLRPGEAEIWRSAAYRFHALIAHQWRKGRVLLAGDAAHQTPPFLGQGMCQGLRDAGNLAWKLDAVLRGIAPESLLDSYTEERRPHVVATTQLAKEFGNIISERDVSKARLRDAAMLAQGGGEPQTLIRQELIPGLTCGLLAIGAPAGASAGPAGTAVAGKVFPQPCVDSLTQSGVWMDELNEPCFRLVIDAAQALPNEVDALAAQSAAQGIVLQVVHSPGAPLPATQRNVMHISERDGVLLGWLASARCIGAIVRPDQYVFGAFTNTAAAATLLNDLSARITGPESEFESASDAESQSIPA